MSEIKDFLSVKDYHKLAQLPPPQHPLLSVIDYSQVNYEMHRIKDLVWRQHYYAIGVKRNIKYKLFYGQQEYDFDEGIMTFIAPEQIMSLSANPNLGESEPSGYLILFHPDFLFQSPLLNRINSFGFFQYSVNEALFLAPREEQVILDLIKNIEQEYHSNIDKFSQRIIISQLTVLLEYAERFYERQFITRQKTNDGILRKVNQLLTEYFAAGKALEIGIPNVGYLSDELSLTPGYLSKLLVTETGKSTQQHIQEKIIQLAKTKLEHSSSSVSEIAYELGFEHPSSFTKLFKKRMKRTPLAYRNSLN